MSESRLVAVESLYKNIFGHLPMHVSFEPSSSVVTVAWYMTDFVRHWPLTGQSAGFLQLQVCFLAFLFFVFLAFVADLLSCGHR